MRLLGHGGWWGSGIERPQFLTDTLLLGSLFTFLLFLFASAVSFDPLTHELLLLRMHVRVTIHILWGWATF